MALVGALLVTLSTAMASAVDNFYWFFIFFSVLGGVGSGLILVQGNVSVQQYFRSKRATANGVFMSGGAVGNMVMPIILRFILVYDMLYLLSFSRHSLTMFGFQITTLIHAAFMSLTILAALTFKPIQGEIIKVSRGTRQIEEGETNKKRCSGIWFPKLSQIFIWKILKNPLFLVLTISVITGR